MAEGGTTAYKEETGLPPLVERAVDLGLALGFDNSCLPEQGRLLAVLAAGRDGGVIGETGTGCGVGLAWMASAVTGATRLVSVEVDPDRARAAAELFADLDHVQVVPGDWSALERYGPFDLLVLDGGGAGKAGETRIDPRAWLKPAGALVIDDFTPISSWPPAHGGVREEARVHWLEHPDLAATEIRTSARHSAIAGLRL